MYGTYICTIDYPASCIDEFQIFFTAWVFAVFIPIIARYTKSIREPIIISFLSFLLFFGLMSGMGFNNYSASWGYPVIIGAGFGWSLAYIMTAAQLSAPAHLITTTSAILLSLRSLGSSMGLGICKSEYGPIVQLVLTLFRQRNLQFGTQGEARQQHCASGRSSWSSTIFP